MLRPRPRSFRRILLLRILLVSIPILLMGQYVTLRKARTSLLRTARQNLTSSATRKAEDIGLSIQSLQASLQTVSQTSLLQSGALSEAEAQLERFTERLSFDVNCIQLNQGSTDSIALSTCDTPLIPESLPLPWLEESLKTDKSSFYLVSVAPSSTTQPATHQPKSAESSTESWQEVDIPDDRDTNFEVVLATPVYSSTGQLRYTLSIQAVLKQLESTAPRSLVGDTVIINQNGLILIHPDNQQVGKNINQVGDSDLLNRILENVRAGTSYFQHLSSSSFNSEKARTVRPGSRTFQNLFGFLSERDEWLAGYNGIEVSISPEDRQIWAVLAVTPA